MSYFPLTRFRKNLSIMNNLIEIKTEITQTSNSKHFMDIINLDITNAYNSTWRHSIIVKLNKIIGIGIFTNLITNFLERRSFRVRSNKFIQENCVPQGLSLLVSLLLIAINDITENCLHFVKCNLYASNLNFGRSKCKNIIKSLLQTAATN